MDYKKRIFTIPVELEEFVTKFHKEHYPYLSRSEFLWECIKLAAMYKYDWRDEDGDYETALNPVGDIIFRYQQERNLRKGRKGSRPKTDSSEAIKIIKKVLRNHKEQPISLTQLAKEAGMGVKTISKYLEKYSGKYWTIYRPNKVGQPLKIALIGSVAEEKVKELIDEQEKERKFEEKRKRVRKRRKRKKNAGE